MGEEDSSEDVMMASAIVYQPPFGRLVGGLMGLIAIGLYQLHAAYETKFRGELKLGEMIDTEEKLVTLAGRTRTVARALAIGAAGAFVVLATYRYDPRRTRGLEEALQALQNQPLGSYMLGTVAVGLLSSTASSCFS